MFFCGPCQRKYDWPESMCKSAGRCEVCKVYSVCNEVPSKFLPVPEEPNKKT